MMITEFNYTELNKTMMDFFGMTITKEVVDGALAFGKIKSFKRGELILGMGEHMEKIYIITQGVARSYYLDNNGNDITKSFMCAINLCVAESFFINEPSTQNFEALEDMVTVEFNSNELKSYMFSNPVLKEIYIKMLEFTIVYKMKRESSFQMKSSMERYIDFRKEYPNLDNKVKQSYIASYLGMTPVSLSRIRRILKE